jgi:hypothetical protein
MSDDETGPIEPDAPGPPTAAPTAAQPAYAMPLPAGFPVGYPAYAVPPQRPRFADQVMGMRAVAATALACLIVGGLGGFVLGRATGADDNRFGVRGPGFIQQRGAFPNGPGTNQAPNPQFGQPNQQFGQGRSGR